MTNHPERNSEYMNSLKDFIHDKYNIHATSIAPAKRGYYGETWKLETSDTNYFVKLDYFSRHQKIYQNSLPVVEYLCNNGIDFISQIVKTRGGELYTNFNLGVLGVFEWIEGESIETDETKAPEYQMLCKIYPLTKQGFNIPTIEFSDAKAILFYEKWEKLKNMQSSEVNRIVNSLFESQRDKLFHCAGRLLHFASICQKDTSGFYLTHGDAGGNFFVSSKRNYIVDWDEVMYAPLERDAWVMCCRIWARKLFNDTLKDNNIKYKLRPERLAFYCYHMYFLYLGEFLEDFMVHGMSQSLEEYFEDSYFMEERISYANTV